MADLVAAALLCVALGADAVAQDGPQRLRAAAEAGTVVWLQEELRLVTDWKSTATVLRDIRAEVLDVTATGDRIVALEVVRLRGSQSCPIHYEFDSADPNRPRLETHRPGDGMPGSMWRIQFYENEVGCRFLVRIAPCGRLVGSLDAAVPQGSGRYWRKRVCRELLATVFGQWPDQPRALGEAWQHEDEPNTLYLSKVRRTWQTAVMRVEQGAFETESTGALEYMRPSPTRKLNDHSMTRQQRISLRDGFVESSCTRLQLSADFPAAQVGMVSLSLVLERTVRRMLPPEREQSPAARPAQRGSSSESRGR